jgi:probable phosphoglycerate mutase
VTRLFLVRHGSHDLLGKRLCGRMPGVDLNAEGQVQARRAAAWLGDEAIAAVYSSPLERAAQTARPIAERHGLDVQTAEALDELDLGEWTGAPLDALRPRGDWQWWNSARGQHRPPGGETMLDVQLRMARWLESVRRSHPEDRVAAVTHGDVIKATLTFVLGLSIDHHDRFEIDPGSVSAIEVADWGLKVRFVNRVPQ